jgi:pimeloyl-ACP methyl ester carboxylesterase
MKGEFCRVITADGLELQGLFACPGGRASETSVLHVHGMDGNFYENRFVDDVADAAVRLGINFLTVNNRGHDYISDFICEKGDGTTEYRQIGGIYEMFGECVLDIEAWIEFLASRGTRHIILQGHSHGALKVLYFLHKRRDPRIEGLVLLSPSDDFGGQRQALGDKFDEVLDVATKLVEDGNGRCLIPEHYFHYPISAASYVDIYNAGSVLKMCNLSKTDTEDFGELSGVAVPVLVIVGSVDEAFVGSPRQYVADLHTHMRNAPAFDGHVIEGAPHNYLHFEQEVAQLVGQWLRGSFTQ